MFAQVWAHYAADFFKLSDIHCFSGGTSVTALNRNTVMALQQTGFIFKLTKFSHSNPHYRITYADSEKAIMGFSKLFDDETINKPFIAITTCDNADENCPFIPNARLRFHLPFVDPKKYDHTKYQTEKYMATSKRIAGEMHFLFEKINNSL
jgi:arsenate reductase